MGALHMGAETGRSRSWVLATALERGEHEGVVEHVHLAQPAEEVERAAARHEGVARARRGRRAVHRRPRPAPRLRVEHDEVVPDLGLVTAGPRVPATW